VKSVATAQHTPTPARAPERARTPFFQRGGTKARGAPPFFVQARLEVSQPDDPHEREADRTADHVMRTLDAPAAATDGASVHPRPGDMPTISRISLPRAPARRAGGEEPESVAPEEQFDEPLQRMADPWLSNPAAGETGGDGAGSILRKPASFARPPLRHLSRGPRRGDPPVVAWRRAHATARPATGGGAASSGQPIRSRPDLARGPPGGADSFAQRLTATKGRGQPLPESTRGPMESAFGADFSRVRIHSDEEAGRLANRAGAVAFAHENDVYFNRGAFEPHTRPGRHLLAHELTHVVQQGHAVQRRAIQRAALPPRPLHGSAAARAPPGPAAHRLATPAGLSLTTATGPRVQRNLIPGWARTEINGIAENIPGYALMTVLVGYNPILDAPVAWTASNFFRAAAGLIPGGTLVFDKLNEAGAIDDAFAWIEARIAGRDLTIGRVRSLFTQAWDRMDFLRTDPIAHNVGVVRDVFAGFLADVAGFAGEVVGRLVAIFRELAVRAVRALFGERCAAYDLITQILGSDPLTGEARPWNTADFLRAALRLFGFESHLAKMEETGQVERAAAWIDAQVGLLVSAYSGLATGIVGLWTSLTLERLLRPDQLLADTLGIVLTFYGRLGQFVLTLAARVLELIKDALVGLLRAHVHEVPGYRLFTVVLGKDPVTGEEVPRTAENFLLGFLSFIPNGVETFENIRASGALPAALAWLLGLINELGLSPDQLRERFLSLWRSFTIDDLLNPIGAFLRIAGAYLSYVRDVLTLGLRVYWKVLEIMFVFLLGPGAARVMAALHQGEDTFRLIISDPVGFLRNLLGAIGQGIRQFGANIWKHIKGGLIQWMLGSLQGAGIEMPETFDLRGVVSIVMQLLGLTYRQIRPILVKRLGEPAVENLERAFDFIRTLMTEGFAGVWQQFLAWMGDLKGMVLQAVTEWVVSKLVMAGLTRLATLWNPVGWAVEAVMAIYNTVMFFIERMEQILDFVEAVIRSVSNIAQGRIGDAANYVENAMARTIPVIISFCASLLGLGGISSKIRGVIQKIQDKVHKAIDTMIGWVMNKAKAVLGGTGASKEEKEADLKDAESAVSNAIQGSAELDDARSKFPAIIQKFNLQRIDLVDLGKPTARVEIQRNPVSKISLQNRDGNCKLIDETGEVSPFGTATDVTFGGPHHDGGLLIGATKMEARYLGPNHPQGYETGSRGIEKVMSLLPTTNMGAKKGAFPQPRGSENTYVAGHLLNHDIGGPAEDENLFPLTSYANNPTHAAFEATVKEWVNVHRYWVYYRVLISNIEVHLVDTNRYDPGNYVNCTLTALAYPYTLDGQPSNERVTQTIRSQHRRADASSPQTQSIPGAAGPGPDTGFAGTPELKTSQRSPRPERHVGTITSAERANRIRTRAYALSRATTPQEYWLQAEQQVARQLAGSPGTDPAVRERMIRDAAYFLSKNASPQEFWLRAEREIDAELQRTGIAVQAKRKNGHHSSAQPDRSSALQASRGMDRATNRPAHTVPNLLASAFAKATSQTIPSGVRLHTDEGAACAANSLGARAFTHGRDIFFNRGEYAPHTRAGRHLLAHELTHVVQQSRGGGAPRAIQRAPQTPPPPAPPGVAPAPAPPAPAPVAPASPVAPGAPPTSGAPTFTLADGTHIERSPQVYPGSPTPRRRVQVNGISLPTFKSRNRRRFPRVLAVRPVSREASDTQQGPLWRQSVQEPAQRHLARLCETARTRGGHDAANDTYFFRARSNHDLFVIGTAGALLDAAMVPFWSEDGRQTAYQIDHIVEDQLVNADDPSLTGLTTADRASNFELLEAGANGAAGIALSHEINRRLRKVATDFKEQFPAEPPIEFGALRHGGYYVTFLAPTFDLAVAGGEPNNFWSHRAIIQGEHLRKIEPLTARQLHGLGHRGSPPLIFLSGLGGQAARVPPADQLPKENWLPRITLQGVEYAEAPDAAQPVTAIHVSAYRAAEAREGFITSSYPDMRWPLLPVPGVHGGAVDVAHVRQNHLGAALSLHLRGMSPVELTSLDLGPRGLTALGKVLPTIPFIRGADIDLVIDGRAARLRKRFGPEEISLPAPFRVDDCGLEVFAGTNGLGASGHLAFSIPKVGRGRLTGSVATQGGLEVAGQFDFDPKLFSQARITVGYRDGAWDIGGKLAIGAGRVRGVRSAEVDVAYAADRFTATGAAELDIPGVQRGAVNLAITPEGFSIGGDFHLGGNIPGIKSGRLGATVAHDTATDRYAVSARGTAVPRIPGVSAEVSVVYDDGALDIGGTVEYRRNLLAGRLEMHATNRAIGDDGKPAGGPTGTFTLFGGGRLEITITPWLKGTVSVTLLPNGELEVGGEIAVPKSIPVFGRRATPRAELFGLRFDIPIFGIPVGPKTIGLKAFISGGLYAEAGVGPALLEGLHLGFKHFNPDHPESTHIYGGGTFDVRADASISLEITAGIGLDVLIGGVEGSIGPVATMSLEAYARPSATIDWMPGRGFELSGDLKAGIRPRFIFRVIGKITAWFAVWDKTWTWKLAEYEYGPDFELGLKMPLKYKEGSTFAPTVGKENFTYPDVSGDEGFFKGLLRGIREQRGETVSQLIATSYIRSFEPLLQRDPVRGRAMIEDIARQENDFGRAARTYLRALDRTRGIPGGRTT